MGNPRSLRRIGERIATFHVDDEIEISSSLWRNDSLDDRVSRTGPPASSLQGDADLAEMPGSFVYNEDPFPAFDAEEFAASLVEENLVTTDRWMLSLL